MKENNNRSKECFTVGVQEEADEEGSDTPLGQRARSKERLQGPSMTLDERARVRHSIEAFIHFVHLLHRTHRTGPVHRTRSASDEVVRACNKLLLPTCATPRLSHVEVANNDGKLSSQPLRQRSEAPGGTFKPQANVSLFSPCVLVR